VIHVINELNHSFCDNSRMYPLTHTQVSVVGCHSKLIEKLGHSHVKVCQLVGVVSMGGIGA
jgi:hypothetical protein